jgi:hypothetical protein
MSEFHCKAGAAKRKISPTDGIGPVYRAGYKMGEAEEIQGIVDDIFLRCLVVDKDDARIVLLSFDLIGLFRDFAAELASRLAPQGIGIENLIVAATHMHSGPDTMGLWGPSMGESGYNDKYGEFLLRTAAEAVAEAISSAKPARALFSFAKRNLGVANFREPDELNLALWQIRFEGANGCVGSLVSYSAQPELAPRDDDRISAGYPGRACRILDKEQGGTSLFLLGTCGGMEPEGCEKGYDEAHAYGKRMAEELLAMAPAAKTISEGPLAVETEQVRLPVENPGFQMMMEMGVIRTSQKPPEVITTISKIRIGSITIFALPGESFPGIVRDLGTGGEALFIDQVNDSLGYFIPPEQFRADPVEWAEGHHFTGHELESLGRGAGDAIRKGLLNLASRQ